MIVTVLVTLALVLIGLNLFTGEKRVKERVEHLYSIQLGLGPRLIALVQIAGGELSVLLRLPLFVDGGRMLRLRLRLRLRRRLRLRLRYDLTFSPR